MAYARHFPAINWLTSYSLYADSTAKWFNGNVHEDWAELKQQLMRLLQEEAELDEIVKLVGMDALSPRPSEAGSRRPFVRTSCIRMRSTRSTPTLLWKNSTP